MLTADCLPVEDDPKKQMTYPPVSSNMASQKIHHSKMIFHEFPINRHLYVGDFTAMFGNKTTWPILKGPTHSAPPHPPFSPWPKYNFWRIVVSSPTSTLVCPILTGTVGARTNNEQQYLNGKMNQITCNR